MILSTGATERNKANNIYDLAGNLAELTLDHEEDKAGYTVGGYYSSKSFLNDAKRGAVHEDEFSYHSVRNAIYKDASNPKQGFRVVLYIK